MKKRQARREATIRKGAERRDAHLQRIHPTGVVDCVCEKSIWWFAKRKGLGCDKCRGRKHGNPKLGAGPCKIGLGSYRPAVMARIVGKRVVQVWRRAACVDDVEI